MPNNGHPLLVLLVCLLKSFKELFIYQTLTKGHPLLSGEPLFSEASAKVRTFSEPRKSFREKFSNLTHFPAVVDGGQGHIRHTHYYILYRRRGNGAGGTEGNVRHVANIKLYVCVYSLYVVSLSESPEITYSYSYP